MASYEQLDYGSPDGSRWGSAATDKLGMYGATPVVQGSAGAASTYVVHGQTTGSATTYGLNSAAAVTSLVAQVSQLTVALRNIGLIA